MPLNIHFDLELILLVGVLLTGIIWLAEKFFLGDKHQNPSKKFCDTSDGQGTDQVVNKSYRGAWYVETSKSFFPILFIVLVLRSFVAEPFRIPSGSMMPTLLHGDFILVNKFAYGIRLPVLHTKILDVGSPQRGDVVVFRFPKDPSDDYIKRVIGLPGDHIVYKDKVLFINGKRVDQIIKERYQGTGTNSMMNGAVVLHENIESVRHDILVNYSRFNAAGEFSVPDNHYFVMGDNRDHSSDSRVWGVVPEGNLVGRAFLIWMNWDFSGRKFNFERIGQRII